VKPRTLQFEQLEPRQCLAALIAVVDTGTPLNRYGNPLGVIRKNFVDAKASVIDFDGHARAVWQAARSAAPSEARFAFLKVSTDAGLISAHAVNDAMQWIEDYRGPHTFVSVTLAHGSGGNFTVTPRWAFYEENLRDLKELGITAVAAAGNSYPGTPGATYPGISKYVVCAMASSGTKLQPWSQRISTGLAVDEGSTSRATGKLAGHICTVVVAGSDEPVELLKRTADVISGGWLKVNINRARAAA